MRLDTLMSLADPMTIYQLLAGAALALAIYLIWHRSRNPLALPAILISGIVAHIVFALSGLSLEQVQALGWTFRSPPRATLTTPWHLSDIQNFPWEALPGLVGNLIAVIFVTAISTLFNTTGLEVATGREAISSANSLSPAPPTSCRDCSAAMPMHLAEPFAAQRQRQRDHPRLGTDCRSDRRPDAGGGPGTARLHAEIHPWRTADLSRQRPAQPLDHRIQATPVDH
jgi:hypothetical protein